MLECEHCDGTSYCGHVVNVEDLYPNIQGGSRKSSPPSVLHVIFSLALVYCVECVNSRAVTISPIRRRIMQSPKKLTHKFIFCIYVVLQTRGTFSWPILYYQQSAQRT
jgi:hypothetical protein